MLENKPAMVSRKELRSNRVRACIISVLRKDIDVIGNSSFKGCVFDVPLWMNVIKKAVLTFLIDISGNALFQLAQQKLQTKGLCSKDISPHDKSGCLIVFVAINIGLHNISA